MEVRVKRQRTLDALRRVLLAEALRQPLVLIVEDLHWIDEQTQALLDLLVESVPAARGLILFNYRPEYRHNWTNKSYYTQIRLNPLSEADGTTMLAALLGEGAELAPLKRMIAERTGGNPFFIEEIVQALFEDGSLVRNGAVRLMRSLSQLRLPPTVQGILTGRIDRLSAGQKDLLEMLAVIGRQSSLNVLRRLVPSDDAKLERTLAELRAGEFIYDQPSAEDVVYVFKHALTQEVAYSSLLVERRRVLHERVGNAIEELFSNRLDEHSGELAYHYSRSSNAEKALTYLRSAGELAVRRSADLEGAALFNSALEMVGQLPETPARDKQELDLLLELGPALMSIKGFAAAECEAVYRRANDVCRRIGETPRLYTVLWGQ
jgi:predicted ATPase